MICLLINNKSVIYVKITLSMLASRKDGYHMKELILWARVTPYSVFADLNNDKDIFMQITPKKHIFKI